MSSRRRAGFVLTELLVAGLLSTFLLLGLIQMAAGIGRSLLLVESLSQTQQGGRFAIQQVRDIVMDAGFDPSPWQQASAQAGLSEETSDGGENANDVVVVRQLSDRNCFGNPNPVHDAAGNPAFFIRKSRLDVSGGRNLAHTCHYGPSDDALVRQINRQGLVRRVESFQALFAEDSDSDGFADRLVRAGNWSAVGNVVGVEIGVLVASEDAPAEPRTASYTVLDRVITAPRDGRLRQVWTSAIPLVSKLR